MSKQRGSNLVIEDYVLWLAKIYASHMESFQIDDDLILTAIRIIQKHASRLSNKEDFISLSAAEAANRMSVDSGEKETLPPFLTLLDRSADAVRHRVSRAAKSWPLAISMLDKIPSRDNSAPTLIEILEKEFNVEDHLIIQSILNGMETKKIANQLGISLRTLYRRIHEIKAKINQDIQ